MKRPTAADLRAQLNQFLIDHPEATEQERRDIAEMHTLINESERDERLYRWVMRFLYAAALIAGMFLSAAMR